MHKVAFQTGVNEIILFDAWEVSDWKGIVWSMVGIALMAMMYEGLKNYREYLFVHMSLVRKVQEKKQSVLHISHLVQTFLHIVQIIVSYFLMLIFMTYNVWLCIAIVVGAAIGYWLFSWEKSTCDVTECCQ